MNWNNFGTQLKTMLGMTGEDVTPDQILEKLQSIVESNTKVVESAADLGSIQESLDQITSDVSTLSNVLANHKETLQELMTASSENSTKIASIAKAVSSKKIDEDSLSILTLNKDKNTEFNSDENDEKEEIVLDTDIMLQAKNTRSWPKL